MNVVPWRSRLHVMGDFRLVIDREHRLLPLHARRLLGCLALAESVQSRASVARRLWSDLPDDQARASLRNAMWQVRHEADSVLTSSRDHVGLDARLDVDLQDARTRARHALNGEVDENASLTIDVLDRDLLPGWDEDWLLIDRERQRQLRMHALEVLSTSLCDLGRFPEAVIAALSAVAAEPLRESSQKVLILAYLGEHNVCEALRQLTAYRRLLRKELGIAPSPELAALVRDARVGGRR